MPRITARYKLSVYYYYLDLDLNPDLNSYPNSFPDCYPDSDLFYIQTRIRTRFATRTAIRTPTQTITSGPLFGISADFLPSGGESIPAKFRLRLVVKFIW